jgi:HSP20 family molecular chaperone IbpA
MPQGETTDMYLDDLIDSIALDPFTPLFSKRKDIRSSFDARTTIEGDDLKIYFDVPGSKREDVDVTFEPGNTIKVIAKRSDTGSTSTWRYSIPEAWDRESADAKIEDGVLTIQLAKKEREKTRKLLIK